MSGSQLHDPKKCQRCTVIIEQPLLSQILIPPTISLFDIILRNLRMRLRPIVSNVTRSLHTYVGVTVIAEPRRSVFQTVFGLAGEILDWLNTKCYSGGLLKILNTKGISRKMVCALKDMQIKTHRRGLPYSKPGGGQDFNDKTVVGHDMPSLLPLQL